MSFLRPVHVLRIVSGFVFSASIAPLGSQAASPPDRWIHVAVDGSAEDPERIRVNLPLTLISALEPILRSHCGDHDSALEFDGTDFDRKDLVAIVQALKTAKDGEYVTVDDDEDHVRVTKEKGVVLIHVTEQESARDAERAEKHEASLVDIRLPIPVLEALISGSDDELDLAAALNALAASDHKELVSVQDGDERVRVWIDEKNTSD